jgi:hypothetical protein
MRLLVLALAVLVLALTGCTAAGARSQAYSSGAEQPSVRAAVDGNGDLSEPQELAAFNLPLGPFTLKAGLIWNGTAWVPGIPGAASAQAAPCAAPTAQTEACGEQVVQSFSTEAYQEMVPVTRYRKVATPATIRTWRTVTPGTPYVVEECAPAPQAAPQFNPCPPPAAQDAPLGPPPAGTSMLPCPPCCRDGCCTVPGVQVARAGR